jgi:hypothetical protein
VRLFSVVIGIEEEQINIGIGKQPASSKSSVASNAKFRGPVISGRDQILPQPFQNIFNQPGALRYSGATVTVAVKSRWMRADSSA